MNINLQHQGRDEKDNYIEFHADIDAANLKIEETPFGVRIDLGKEFKVLTEPGTPALPSRIVQVALPGNAADITIKTKTGKSRKLFKKPVFIMPVPEYEVAAKENGNLHKLTKEETERLRNVVDNATKEARNIPSPLPRFVPDQEKYNRSFTKPSPIAEISSVVAMGANNIVSVRLNPITIGNDYIPELHESIDVIVQYTTARQSKQMDRRIHSSLPQQEDLRESIFNSLKETVINPMDILDINPYPWVIFGPYNYIVITDNYRWNSETMTRTDEVGDMKSVFERLVSWKIQKGLKARVVTITDIMNNVYGNFKVDAVDLQEVIRNFLKFAHSNWGICWCLLGGDTEIVPIRKAAGECRGTINETTVNNPPMDNECFWTGTFMKIKAVSLGEWFSVHDSYLRLTNRNTGRLIPKKAPRNILVSTEFTLERRLPGGPSLPDNAFRDYLIETTEQFRNRLGWYFCTDDTYSTYSATPTNFVRVDGAAAIIHAPLRFHYTWNTIPTDFYYASLFGPSYNIPGRHDWDYNNNRIYGQHEGITEFDPINWNSDICVGRAPASNPSEAEVFVNKVVAYEQFRRADGGFLDPNYVDKMLLVSENWGGRLGYYPTASNPPEAGRFHTQAAQSRAILQTSDDTNLDWNWQLISWINDNDVWVIPYNRNANVGIRGYYFAWSATDLRPAVFSFNLPWGLSFEIPLITHTLVIYGNASDIAPNRFILDHVPADGSMMDQEALRQQVDTDIAVIQRFNRLYEDIDSLPLANRLAAPVSRLTAAQLETALNEGQHFVSLSGHGSQYGCCMLSNWRAATLTNTNKCFIAFADSCLTNAYESSDSMSEDLIKNPSGGAIAYVGHTRFSWIGLGDDYQRAFFHELVWTRHLGLMHRSRLQVLQAHAGDPYHMWSVLALNLLGDPEMEVWKRKPYRVVYELRFIEAKLYVRAWDPDDFGRRELKDISMKLYAGEKEYSPHEESAGVFSIPQEWYEAGDFRVAVSRPGDLPQFFDGKEVLHRSYQMLTDAVQEGDQEETSVKGTQEIIKEMAPVIASDAPVLEMQTEPQHN